LIDLNCKKTKEGRKEKKLPVDIDFWTKFTKVKARWRDTVIFCQFFSGALGTFLWNFNRHIFFGAQDEKKTQATCMVFNTESVPSQRRGAFDGLLSSH